MTGFDAPAPDPGMDATRLSPEAAALLEQYPTLPPAAAEAIARRRREAAAAQPAEPSPDAQALMQRYPHLAAPAAEAMAARRREEAWREANARSGAGTPGGSFRRWVRWLPLPLALGAWTWLMLSLAVDLNRVQWSPDRSELANRIPAFAAVIVPLAAWLLYLVVRRRLDPLWRGWTPWLLSIASVVALLPGLVTGNGASARPCPVSPYGDTPIECITLTLPRDHGDPGHGATVDVTFALHRATGERLGTLVVATGGPGASGVAVAAWQIEVLDQRIAEHYDMVFFDHRGTGLSGRVTCDRAAMTSHGAWASADPDVADVSRDSERFVEACLAEMAIDRTSLADYSTAQAVGDLEAFRRYLGTERLHLYAESYGTRLAQQYAAAYPERVAALLLDGPLDPQTDLPALARESAIASSLTLEDTLASCAEDPLCEIDMAGGDAVAAYEDLAARLLAAPIPYRFPDPNGDLIDQTLTLQDLEAVASASLYDEYQRMQLLRGLAAASRGEMVPLARLAASAYVGDADFSVGAFYTILCADYADFATDPDARPVAYLESASDGELDTLRLARDFYAQLPCAYWPVDDGSEASVLSGNLDFPVFLLTATADPATPYVHAVRIFQRIEDAYLIEVSGGGPHVIFGRGDPCVDTPVVEFLVEGEAPTEDRISCPGWMAAPYVPLPLEQLTDYPNPLEALMAVDDHITNLPELYDWTGAGVLEVGCDKGGTLSFVSDGHELLLHLERCTFMRGLTLTGSGTIDGDAGALRLDVSTPGGSLEYERDALYRISLSGRLNGEPVDLER